MVRGAARTADRTTVCTLVAAMLPYVSAALRDSEHLFVSFVSPCETSGYLRGSTPSRAAPQNSAAPRRIWLHRVIAAYSRPPHQIRPDRAHAGGLWLSERRFSVGQQSHRPNTSKFGYITLAAAQRQTQWPGNMPRADKQT